MPPIDHNPENWYKLCETMKTKNVPGNTKAPEKHKHSAPFYISPALFDNKRLKQKRAKWAALWQTANYSYYSSTATTTTLKTDYYNYNNIKRRSALLLPAETIDLLSDDDDVVESSETAIGAMHTNHNNNSTSHRRQDGKSSNPPPLAPIQGAQPLQHYIIYPGSLPNLQLTTAANLRLISMPSVSMEAFHQQQAQQQQRQKPEANPVVLQSPSKRKRKSHQPKRHSQPLIVNNESIVLTDDSDVEQPAAQLSYQQQKLIPEVTAIAVPTIVHATSLASTPNHNKSQHQQLTPPAAASLSPSRTEQVDEEVTVSLVPRSATGSCTSKTVNNKLFPMLPDETTVHTVIANRIYELSLTKLREGLGIDDVNGPQPKTTPTSRRGKATKANGPTPAVQAEVQQQQQAPVSLKLSSDLSISLISDDEDDEQQHQLCSPEKLRQLAPQLAMQQLRVPADTGQSLPRRRKLG